MSSASNLPDDEGVQTLVRQLQMNVGALAGQLTALQAEVDGLKGAEPAVEAKKEPVADQKPAEPTALTWRQLDRMLRERTQYSEAATGDAIRYAAFYLVDTTAEIAGLSKDIAPAFAQSAQDPYHVYELMVATTGTWTLVPHFWVADTFANLPAISTTAVSGRDLGYTTSDGLYWRRNSANTAWAAMVIFGAVGDISSVVAAKAAGTTGKVADAGHGHDIGVFAAVGNIQAVGAANAAGDSADVPHGNHIHAGIRFYAITDTPSAPALAYNSAHYYARVASAWVDISHLIS
jgi:hypothetical protein